METTPNNVREEKDAERISNELDILFPGTPVPIEGTDVEAIVYPLRVEHLRRFIHAMERRLPSVLSVIGDVPDFNDTSPEGKKKIQNAVAAIAMLAIDDLLDLLEDCVDGVSVSELPQWALPPIAECWIMESFGSVPKVKPWIDALEVMVKRITGKDMHLWQTLSNSLLKEGTPSSQSRSTRSRKRSSSRKR